MLCRPTQTCFWAGRLTPAIRAMTRLSRTVDGHGLAPWRSESEILSGSRVLWKPKPLTRLRPGLGSVPMLRRRPGAGRRGAEDRPARPARYSGARIGPGPPVRETAARVAHLVPGQGPGTVVSACL